MLGRALLLAVTCLLAIACGGSPPTPSYSPTPSTSTSPAASTSATPNASGPTVDEAFCGTIADLESALQSFEAVKIKAANSSKLKDAAAGVKAALTPISDTAAANLNHLVGSLRSAVDGLSGSTENYTTASPSAKAAAEKKLKKSLTTLHTAIAQLRQAASCTN